MKKTVLILFCFLVVMPGIIYAQEINDSLLWVPKTTVAPTIDGQLDECELTLKDLEKICGIFIRLLTSIYHSRITYLNTGRADNHHKSAKEDSRQ